MKTVPQLFGHAESFGITFKQIRATADFYVKRTEVDPAASEELKQFCVSVHDEAGQAILELEAFKADIGIAESSGSEGDLVKANRMMDHCGQRIQLFNSQLEKIVEEVGKIKKARF
jgi:hypothetical protein